jgi:hypothetical protein
MEYDEGPQEGIIIEYIGFLIRNKHFATAHEYLESLAPSPLRLLLTEKIARYIAFHSAHDAGTLVQRSPMKRAHVMPSCGKN